MNNTLLVIEGSFPLPQIDRYLDLLQVDRQRCVLSDSEAVKEPTVYGSALLCLTRPPDRPRLMALFKLLSPGASVLFHVPGTVDTLRRNSILSGFVPTEDPLGEETLVMVKKPEWDRGAKSVIPAPASSKWTVQPDDELLDDDDFLTEEDKEPVISGDKSPVKKACENCTCGRAEGKESAKLTKAMLNNPVTSCGSCGLGDAYRCASCPYRGLPSFEPGKKIELPEGFLVPDL